LFEGGTAWRLWKEFGQEPLRDYDALAGLWTGAQETLWKRVSEVGQTVLGCDFSFLDPFPGQAED
jgi:hypothetical protein